MSFLHAIPVVVLVAGIVEFVWRALLARRAWIRYVRLYRAKIDPDFTDPTVPPIGWPIEPGWRENTPRHPKTYAKNWRFEDGLAWFKIRHDPQPDPEIEAARQQVSDREFEVWMAMIFGCFVAPVLVMVIVR